jgi:uncharacterized repeat protein (TIGR03837 family)
MIYIEDENLWINPGGGVVAWFWGLDKVLEKWRFFLCIECSSFFPRCWNVFLFTMCRTFAHRVVHVMGDGVAGILAKWEIFCRVVDNHGDIGLCWRLARELVARFGVEVKIWVDDWAALLRFCPRAVHDGTRIGGVELRCWKEVFPMLSPADVVIEAFACDLPETHVNAMAARAPVPLWINLEYLSAEAWVSHCHGLASPRPDLPLVKYFFFPGFTAGTGGLIREKTLFVRRERLGSSPRKEWLRGLGIEPPDDAALWVSLFAYEQPALGELLTCWSAGPRPVLLLVPEGRVTTDIGVFFGKNPLPGSGYTHGSLRFEILPFLDQDIYDELLWQCDLNLVRGEDSFVRAQWAARPMAWQVYPQDDGAHFRKLEAFRILYAQGLDEEPATALEAFWRAWNETRGLAAAWPAFSEALPALAEHACAWCEQLGKQADLVQNLYGFCAMKRISS